MTRILTDVETQIDAAGDLRPVAFSYRGQRIQVTSHGRRWDAGARRHYLVMDRHYRTYELACDRDKNRWDMIRSPDRFSPRRSKPS